MKESNRHLLIHAYSAFAEQQQSERFFERANIVLERLRKGKYIDLKEADLMDANKEFPDSQREAALFDHCLNFFIRGLDMHRHESIVNLSLPIEDCMTLSSVFNVNTISELEDAIANNTLRYGHEVYPRQDKLIAELERWGKKR